MDRALKALGAAIDAHDRAQAGTAAIDVAQSTLDLELRYRPQAEIDLARFELWARQILVDGAAGDMGGVNGDVATLDWVRDRFAHDGRGRRYDQDRHAPGGATGGRGRRGSQGGGRRGAPASEGHRGGYADALRRGWGVVPRRRDPPGM